AAEPIVNGKSGQAREILAKMSLEEKAQCVVGLKRDLFPPTNAGIAGRTVPFPQFGVPSLTLADGTAGVRLSRRAAERATAFPDNMALASSWDSNLAQKVGAAVAYEAVGYNVNIMLAPGMNIIRNPLCGRNFEYFSEDPLITGRMAAGYVLGIQSEGVVASAKHFTCNNQETNRGHNNVIISERALREIYLKGFEICVKESNPWTIMSSYNSLGGSPVQEQHRLLTGILRNEWGFDGLVMTDWSIVPHNTAAQLHAGNDLFMPGDDHQVEAIVSGVKDGSIKEEDLDSACLRVLRLAERCGKEPSSQAPDLSKGAVLAKEAACETAVLMKNENTLPLPEGSSVALFGVRSYDLVNTGSGAGFVVSPYVSQINESFKKAGICIDSEIDDLYSKYVQFASADIEYNEKIKVHIGLPLLPELEISKTLIDKAASRNDCAVITIGRSAEEGKDRPLKDDY
ncbi:MAG TPA: glycoside hydrolase family 3 N-terminal domain-containing protein, partial [Candidatus Cryptobacteroides sp.]|nr:glycoside hydrolase family 3 N-terminal domain-containing protein [Candidatus Cryptobacteroides sp.]